MKQKSLIKEHTEVDLICADQIHTFVRVFGYVCSLSTVQLTIGIHKVVTNFNAIWLSCENTQSQDTNP